MKFQYIKVVLIVVATFGIQLIHPFFCKTKGKASHSELQVYFTDLYASLRFDDIDERFFEFQDPCIRGVSSYMFHQIIQNEYSIDVVESLKVAAIENMKESIVLGNIIKKEMATVLSRQRGKYYGFGEHGNEFNVFEQAPNIDRAVTNDIEMERQCGDHDNRLNLKPNVKTVSRGNILKRTTELRDQDTENAAMFRRMGPIVKKIEIIEKEWKYKQDEILKERLSKKETEAIHIECRKYEILQRLKSCGGPFTNENEIDEYLQTTDALEAQKRMKDEITYARDTSRSLPRKCVLFKIMTRDKKTKKNRLMTAQEFGSNLKTIVGKVENRAAVTLEQFQNAMNKLTKDD